MASEPGRRSSDPAAPGVGAVALRAPLGPARPAAAEVLRAARSGCRALPRPGRRPIPLAPPAPLQPPCARPGTAPAHHKSRCEPGLSHSALSWAETSTPVAAHIHGPGPELERLLCLNEGENAMDLRNTAHLPPQGAPAGIKPPVWACDLTRMEPSTLLVYGCHSNQASHTGQGNAVYLARCLRQRFAIQTIIIIITIYLKIIKRYNSWQYIYTR